MTDLDANAPLDLLSDAQRAGLALALVRADEARLDCEDRPAYWLHLASVAARYLAALPVHAEPEADGLTGSAPPSPHGRDEASKSDPRPPATLIEHVAAALCTWDNGRWPNRRERPAPEHYTDAARVAVEAIEAHTFAYLDGFVLGGPRPECTHPSATWHAAWRAMTCDVCGAGLDPETWTGTAEESSETPEPALSGEAEPNSESDRPGVSP